MLAILPQSRFNEAAMRSSRKLVARCSHAVVCIDFNEAAMRSIAEITSAMWTGTSKRGFNEAAIRSSRKWMMPDDQASSSWLQ